MCRSRPETLPPSSTRGLTLIEMVLAIVILAIAATPLLLVFSQAGEAATLAEWQEQAHQLAGDRMEEILRDRRTEGRGFDWIQSIQYPDETPVPEATAYSRSVSVVEVDPSDLTTPLADSGYKLITVTVTHSSPGGGVSLVSVICDL